MKHRKIGNVMTDDVVRVGSGTSSHEVMELLARHRIGGLPVVDEDEKVLGVVSGTDLRTGSDAPTAGQLMSRPAITVRPQDSVVDAARTMARHGVERLPVIDEEDRLVGIVTRRDLLTVFLRPDQEIRAEVIDEVLIRSLWLLPHVVDVTVTDGVVRLEGQLERHSEVPIAVRMAGQVDGVVAVVDRLTYRVDDAALPGGAPWAGQGAGQEPGCDGRPGEGERAGLG
ncbi:CBS domain-containing protein [Streptomyces sp. ME19-01-6]|uniref:CBS domain-containing protein n=1 Tax=Streptomyces sp. ME19-01-6 TaxID=3028686 RepID=UPI0029B47543|nr:CBS domain-containing protein [Streptomyces sp. ME19-01-6]MDX3233108.1 CBS domain-containing protein [Streptomyces sp. ME19-01-6]